MKKRIVGYELIEPLLRKFNLTEEEYLSYFIEDDSSDILLEKIKNLNEFVDSRFHYACYINLEEVVFDISLNIPSIAEWHKNFYKFYIKDQELDILSSTKSAIHDFIIHHADGIISLKVTRNTDNLLLTVILYFEKEEDYQKFLLFY